MFHSIRARLTCLFILFFAIIESIQLLSIYFFLNDAFLSQKEKTIVQAFDQINDDQIEDASVFADIVSVMQDYETTSNLYFCLVNRDTDELLYSTNNSIATNADFTDVDDEAYDEEADASIISGYNSNDYLVLYRSILTDTNCYNTVIWTCYEAELNNTVIGLSPIFILTILLSCLVGAVLALQFAGHIVQPIKAIDEAAQRIAKQDFSSPIPLPRFHDELYRLSGNVNQMSKQLERDMDELTRANRQLEADIEQKQRIDQMRKEFLSNVSHELKTPLAIITSYAEMLNEAGSRINQQEYLAVILDESRQMNEMIGRLLNLSRLEYATEHLTLTPANISVLAEELTQSRSILFAQKGISYTSEITPDLWANWDQTYLPQAFDNYLSNAVKYTSPNGSVRVTLTADENTVTYSVENTCEPLSDEEQQSIWESFYKVDKARSKDRYLSVGLGLYIVKTIVEAHAGTYGVASTKTGVRFYITLPRITADSHESITNDC